MYSTKRHSPCLRIGERDKKLCRHPQRYICNTIRLCGLKEIPAPQAEKDTEGQGNCLYPTSVVHPVSNLSILGLFGAVQLLLSSYLRPVSMLLIFKNKEMRATNPTSKSLMKNVDFTECFCTNSEEKVKLHIIHHHFLKILSSYFFLFPTNSISLSGPSPNPPLQLLPLCITSSSTLLFSLVYVLPKQALLSFFLIFQCLSYFLILFLGTPVQHSGALKCVSSTSTFFRIPPFNKELIFEDVRGGCSREVGNRFLLR